MNGITGLNIDNWRTFSTIALEGLGRINLFVGANDTGKTSLLEALFVAGGVANAELAMRVQHFRDPKSLTITDLSTLFHRLQTDKQVKIEIFLADGAKHTMEVSLSDEAMQTVPLEEVSDALNGDITAGVPMLRCVTTIRQSDGSEQTVRSRLAQTDAGIQQQLPDDRSLLTRHAIKTRFHSSHWRPPQSDEKIVTQVIVQKRKADLLEILRRIDPQIEDFATGNGMIYLDVGIGQMMPITLFGDGLILAVRIVSAAMVSEETMLLIDQIEDGLHYRGIGQLLKALVGLSIERNIQLFIATHSIDVLNALQYIIGGEEYAHYREEVVCYHLARGRNRRVHSYRYDYSALKHAIDEEIEIR